VSRDPRSPRLRPPPHVSRPQKITTAINYNSVKIYSYVINYNSAINCKNVRVYNSAINCNLVKNCKTLKTSQAKKINGEKVMSASPFDNRYQLDYSSPQGQQPRPTTEASLSIPKVSNSSRAARSDPIIRRQSRDLQRQCSWQYARERD